MILDIAGRAPLSALEQAALAPAGVLVVVGAAGDGRGPSARSVRPMAAVVRSRLGGKRMVPFIAKSTRDDLLALGELATAGALLAGLWTGPTRSTGPAKAIGHLETGHALGQGGRDDLRTEDRRACNAPGWHRVKTDVTRPARTGASVAIIRSRIDGPCEASEGWLR